MLRRIAALVVVLLVLPPASVHAFIVFVGGAYPPAFPMWFVRCNAGNLFVLQPGLDINAATALAEGLCENFGGVADITDGAMQAALDAIDGGSPASTATIGRSLGGGTYEALTPADIETLAPTIGPNGLELVGYELLSLDLGGTELVPNAVSGLTKLPVYGAWSNEDDTGPSVGGSTVATVPGLRGGVALLAALIGAGIGALQLRRRIMVGDQG